MVKRVQISTNGSTWYTFPGSQGSKKFTRATVKDTVFGQNYDSMLPTLIESEYDADSYFKGIAGYNAIISKTGVSTSTTGEACSLVSGKTYQITAAAHRLLDVTKPVTVLDNSVNQSANVASIDYLSGSVTFLSTYTPTGPITLTGYYLPLTVAAKAQKWTLTNTSAEIDASCYDDAQANSGFRTFTAGLQTVKLQLDNIFNATNAWASALISGSLLYMQADLEGATNPGMEIWRGMFYQTDNSVQGNVGALEQETLTFDLYVSPNSLMLQPFGWYFNASSQLPTAVMTAINAWQSGATVYVRYLPSGTPGQTPMDGWSTQALVTECSLANDANGQNTFTMKLRGTGASSNV